jgi:tRNA-specific 2-thiouridylase
VQLLKAQDATKDQSYFLHRLTQAQLSKAIFPLYDIPKSRVREVAAQIGLHNAGKKDSTGICFIGERPFREFLNRYLPTKPGPILDDQGRFMGEHVGLAFYTLGQRKGIGIGGQKDGSGAPWFVARKDMARNALYVVQGHEHPWLHTLSLEASQTHWIGGKAPVQAIGITAKTRYRQLDAPCHIDLSSGEHVCLVFESPQWAVTPGQSAVFYCGEVCLGGAIIEAASKQALQPAGDQSFPPDHAVTYSV